MPPRAVDRGRMTQDVEKRSEWRGNYREVAGDLRLEMSRNSELAATGTWKLMVGALFIALIRLDSAADCQMCQCLIFFSSPT